MIHTRRSTTRILADAVASLSFTVEIKNVADNGDGTYTLTTCDIYHAQAGFNVTIGGQSYKIESIEAPYIMVVSGNTYPPSSFFNLYTPAFFYGTPYATDIDLKQEASANVKTPMIWLLIPFNDRVYSDIEEIHDREITCKLYFLTQGNSNKWLTYQSYANAVIPMQSLVDSFITKLRATPAIFDMTDVEYTAVDYPKFGVYITMKGVEKRLFADDLAGVEVSITLPIFRSPYCDDCPPESADDYMLYEDYSEHVYQNGEPMLYQTVNV